MDEPLGCPWPVHQRVHHRPVDRFAAVEDGRDSGEEVGAVLQVLAQEGAVSHIMVTLRRRRAALRVAASRRTSLSMTAMAAPDVSAGQHSKVKASQEKLEGWATTSPGPRPANRSLSTIRQSERCSIMTPLGVPVEPEVKITWARPSGSTGTPGSVSGRVAISCQSWSISSRSADVSPSRSWRRAWVMTSGALTSVTMNSS